MTSSDNDIISAATSWCTEGLWALSHLSLCLLQSMFDYLDNAVIKLCDMSTVGTDLGTVKQQIEELKVGNTLTLRFAVE